MYNSSTASSMQQHKEVSMTDFLIQQAPTDSISSIQYSPVEDLLTACSWDGSIYIYAPSNPNSHETMALKTSIPNPNGSPILCSCFSSDGRYFFTGSADGVIRVVDMTTGNMNDLGTHSQAVSCMTFTNAMTLITGSWDKTVKVWNINAQNPLQKELIMEDKVFDMDSRMSTISILLSTSIVSYDTYTLEKIQTPPVGYNKVRTGMGYTGTIQSANQNKFQIKSQWQLRCIACSNDGMDAIIGTSGSKAEIIAVRQGQMMSSYYYSFKCKQSTVDRNVYPINSVKFHPAFPTTIMTAGSDGMIMLWNKHAKCRLGIGGPGKNTPEMSITSTSFNSTGRYLAIAVGYDWSRGYKPQISTPVEIRIMPIPEDIHTKTGLRI